MGKEADREREFSDNIDRLLAGEEVTAGKEMDEDYQTAIDFSKKLIESRVEPSPHFKAQLKQRLLLKLAQQEAEAARQKERAISFWEFLRNLVPQSPVWRTATVTIVVIIVAMGVLWRTGVFTQSPEVLLTQPPMVPGIGAGGPEEGAPPPALETPPQILLELEAVPLKTAVFPFGETVEIGLVFKNTSSESISVTPFPPAIHIVGSRTVRPVRSFTEGDESRKLSPLETISHTLVWDQRDSSGEQVAPGWYTVHVGEVTISKDTELTETRVSFPSITKLLIQFPQGAMEKVIELNQTQTAGGLSITLERVELHDRGVIFSAFTTPPNYSPPQSSKTHPLKGLVPALAEYTVDGVTIQAKYSELLALEDGIRMIWGQGESYLDPVPSEATELVIRIISFGEWQGPWEFVISLQD